MKAIASPLALCLLLAVAALPPAGAAPPGLPGSQEFEFQRLNGTYSEPNPQLAPIQQGVITVQLRSPSNSLDLKSHSLRLKPGPGGLHSARLEARFEGRGQLEADVEIAGRPSAFKDEVVLPLQTVVVEGIIRLRRVDGGYLVTSVDTQEQVTVNLESRLASSLVGTCQQMQRLLPVGLGCGGLGQAMSRAAIPLPKAGETFELSDELLTEQDRRQLDSYLAGR